MLQSIRRISAFGAVALATLGLSGCFNEEIDARQTQEIQGLLYKVHADDPFTGRVLNYPMNFLGIMSLGSCAMDIKKGLPDGEVRCSDNSGNILATGEFKAGKRNGKEEKFDPATGTKTFAGNWKDGRQDGLQEQFNPKNGKLIHEVHYSAGQKDGRERVWDDSGEKLTTDLVWENGRQTGFVSGGASLQYNTYLNGKRNGVQKSFGIDGNRLFVMSEENYVNDEPDGVQKKFNSDGKVTESSVFDHGKIRSRTKDDYNSAGVNRHHVSLLALSDDANQFIDSSMSKDGLEQYWDDKGRLIRELQWDKGQLVKATATVWVGDRKESEFQGVVQQNTIGIQSAVKQGHERIFSDSGELQAIIVWDNGYASQLLLPLPPELRSKYPGKMALLTKSGNYSWPVHDMRYFEEVSRYTGDGDGYARNYQDLVDVPAAGQLAKTDPNAVLLQSVADLEGSESTSSVDACVMKKSDAVHAENPDALVTHDMIEEFTQECSQ
ncbi:toxin-antitoxin system YwqK family antitoxin [Pseudomonas aeruginosa]